MKLIFRKAFTLMEVNIAIFIMSVGVLSMVSLYSLGYREQSQGKEDVEEAATAELYLAPLMASLSDPDLTWEEFNSIESSPSDGWASYVDNSRSYNGINAPNVQRNASNLAKTAFSKTYKGKGGVKPDSNLEVALVVQHVKDSPIVSLSIRSGKRLGALMSQPIYYTEVHFQGDPNNDGGEKK